MMDTGFKLWCEKGIVKLQDLFIDNNLMSFQQIMDKYELSKSEFFRFLQIRHFIQKSTTLKDNFEISPVERLLFLNNWENVD